MREELAGWLTEQRGRPTEITELTRISTGHSRAMWRITTSDGHRYVARVEQYGVFGCSSSEEFRIMKGLAEAGYPVAPVRWYEPDPDVIGQPFFVMDHLDWPAAEREDRGLSATTAEHYVETLAALHELDPTGIEFDLVPDTPDDATHLQIERWAAIYRTVRPEPEPLLEEAAAWLHHHAPPLERVSVVHADPGPGNLIDDGERVVAVTDWEFAHLGDPMEDWVYSIEMRGRRTMGRQAWQTLFERIAGVTITDEQYHYWATFNLYKGACANTTTLAIFESGANRAPNMLMIGTGLQQLFMRRMAELVGERP